MPHDPRKLLAAAFGRNIERMTERRAAPATDRFFVRIDERWWALGVVDGFHRLTPRPGVVDGYSYSSGRVEGQAAREQGSTVDVVLTKYKSKYREADFRAPPAIPRA